MTVEQSRVIDIISVAKRTGQVVLTICDHLDWSNTVEHLSLLQAKLNAYLAFVESGEILESYPEAKNRPVLFKIVFKFRPDMEGREFLTRVQEIVRSAGFELSYELFAESYDN